ncbi:MAG TPA: chorismate mutase [Candidatus Saccharimonadales bacterium]|nr:chorismate mutase [Candidatus Saccharimonadales bacterium]
MEDISKITKLREEIDRIDEQLVALLNKRAQVSLKIRVAKGSSSIYRPEREAEVINNVTAASKGPLSGEAIATLFHTIIYVCRSIQEVSLPEKAPRR